MEPRPQEAQLGGQAKREVPCLAPHPVAAALKLLSSFSNEPQGLLWDLGLYSYTAATMFGRKRSVSFGGFGWWVTAEMRVDLEKGSHWVAGSRAQVVPET